MGIISAGQQEWKALLLGTHLKLAILECRHKLEEWPGHILLRQMANTYVLASFSYAVCMRK